MLLKLNNSRYLTDKRLPLALVKFDPQQESEPHCHEFSELVIVFRGSGKHIIYGENRTISAGDVFLIHNSIRHQYVDLQDMALYNILFNLKELNNPLQSFCCYPAITTLLNLEPDPNSSTLLHLNEDELEQVLKIVRAIEAEQAGKASCFPMAMAAHFVSLVVMLARFSEVRNLAAGTNRSCVISDLINRISENISHRWTRPEMAKAAKLSISSLHRMFTEYTGYSPSEYLIILRLKKAAMLIRNTGMSIGEISDVVGFSDSNYFSRQFKKHFNVPPQKYRCGKI